ncbi:hypothetical protein LJR290_003097 [Variovorax sp. LjRoot290]|uniref:hypothetical protein n=1 Tax=unclassified Variovorax TaxID=663243 RepID=UPI003ECC1DE5
MPAARAHHSIFALSALLACASWRIASSAATVRFSASSVAFSRRVFSRIVSTM